MGVGHETDAEMIKASLDDPAQFAVVYDRHAGTVFRYLVRRVGRDIADELLGDTFRVAFENRATYEGERSNARPWLYGIASNLVAKYRRTEGRRLRATARLAVDTVSDALVDRVVAAVDAATAWPMVMAALSELPDGERDALLLHAWEGLSYDEIALALSIPIGTVRSRLNRARVRLRDLTALRPDLLQSTEPNDPWILARERDRLMSVAEHTTFEERPAWHPPAIYPRLGYEDELAAIEFLTRAFGFRERREARMEHETGVLAWLEHGDGVVMVGHVNHDVHKIHSPAENGVATCMLNVSVDDVDAHFDRAKTAGALITMELNDAFYGERRYEAEDPEGNRWHFGEPLEHVRRRRGEIIVVSRAERPPFTW